MICASFRNRGTLEGGRAGCRRPLGRAEGLTSPLCNTIERGVWYRRVVSRQDGNLGAHWSKDDMAVGPYNRCKGRIIITHPAAIVGTFRRLLSGFISPRVSRRPASIVRVCFKY